MPNLGSFKTKDEFLAYYREYRHKNREKLREYNRIYNSLLRKKTSYRSDKLWKKNNPKKVKAHMAISYLIKSGIIKRGRCEVCKEKNANAHHPDYNKPLEVIWLCPLHHNRRHHPQ